MTWEYLAGFFDGEGNIYVRDSDEGRKRAVRISIVNTNTEVLGEIGMFLSGEGINAVTYTTERDNPAHAECGHLTLTGAKNIYMFLVKITPHLIVKRDEAFYAIEWLWDLAERAAAGEFQDRGRNAEKAYLPILDS